MAIVLVAAIATASCTQFANSDAVSGWPDVDLGAEVEIYKSTNQRDLHLHIFRPDDGAPTSGAILFFHGGGFRTTRVEQFERQARAAAAAGIVGMVVEYRVTDEGTNRDDAILDGANALAVVRADAGRLGVDPNRLALAGSSAGGALAVEANAQTAADAIVLFNPAVGPDSASFIASEPVIVFHSRADTIVPFSSAEGFCTEVERCEMVAFNEGDHGFFNDEPAYSETTSTMIEFLQTHGW